MNAEDSSPARASNTEPGLNQNQVDSATCAAQGKPIDLEALGVPDYYHAASERFLVRNDAGRWLPHSVASYRRVLGARGLKTRSLPGEQLTEADLEMVKVQNQFDISEFGPLCGRNAGFIEENGVRFVVTEDMQLITPKEGDWALIMAVIKGLLCGGETDAIADAQFHTFIGWLKSSVEALRASRHQQQQALALCGPADCGKSLLQHQLVTPCLANRSADAERAFLRGNDFNAELFKAEHLFLDDCNSATSTRERVALGARIKGCTVGATVKSCHGKGRDAVNLQPWWRFTISANDTPEDMMVFPPLNDGVEDKLILLRASRCAFPEAFETNNDRQSFIEKFRGQIPAFLFWLINDYSIPEAFTDRRRFNIRTFHHPDLKATLEGLAPEAELLELIDLAFPQDFASYGRIRHTAAKIEERVTYADKRRADRLFHYTNSCGSYLGRLAKKHPDRVQKSDTAAERGWMLFPPPSAGSTADD